ncbi:phenylalanyl-tRNA synthetase [Klosneuvirus KNV1]|uniref:phenylalanine--tRNA ligase n=1 Tax=Klosneuvirus KNV1 TaxID=1977640 RepID=A0A1V0SLA0_9VIRU|nr:phenylalanyl-tRNA synthetase [Klosneuvirus KNV1]
MIYITYFQIITSMNKSAYCNIPKFIEDKLPRKLHNQKNHPIEIIKNHIYQYFKQYTKYKFEFFDDLNPVVSIEDNFDKLLIPATHPARSKSDTYYVNEKEVLRTHTSAHQNELLAQGHQSFIVTGDVYRKDEIDARHYPVFHQMEILTIVDDQCDPEYELKRMLAGLVNYLFPNCSYRLNPDYFPFTHPSFEIEVDYNGKWLEVLGCGVVQPAILENNGIKNKRAIACGLGLDRLAMIFSCIPDIRYIWFPSEKFLSQYADGKLNKFVPYSDLPSLAKDISFFIPNNKLTIEMDTNKQVSWSDENDFFELIREVVGDLMEEVKLSDSFYNKKSNKYSRTYKFLYSPNDPGMKDPGEFTKLVNDNQTNLRELLKKMDLELR